MIQSKSRPAVMGPQKKNLLNQRNKILNLNGVILYSVLWPILTDLYITSIMLCNAVSLVMKTVEKFKLMNFLKQITCYPHAFLYCGGPRGGLRSCDSKYRSNWKHYSELSAFRFPTAFASQTSSRSLNLRSDILRRLGCSISFWVQTKAETQP